MEGSEKVKTHPQIPVHLICNKTSPFPGLWIGDSAILICWSAVTCKEGLLCFIIRCVTLVGVYVLCLVSSKSNYCLIC
jgi:hypothetical protein